jgi:hypothetical protein
MSALAPIGGLAVCDVEASRRFAVALSGTLGMAGVLDALKLAARVALTGTLAPTGNGRITFVSVRLRGALRPSGRLASLYRRAALAFRGVKGIITKGHWT